MARPTHARQAHSSSCKHRAIGLPFRGMMPTAVLRSAARAAQAPSRQPSMAQNKCWRPTATLARPKTPALFSTFRLNVGGGFQRLRQQFPLAGLAEEESSGSADTVSVLCMG